MNDNLEIAVALVIGAVSVSYIATKTWQPYTRELAHKTEIIRMVEHQNETLHEIEDIQSARLDVLGQHIHDVDQRYNDLQQALTEHELRHQE